LVAAETLAHLLQSSRSKPAVTLLAAEDYLDGFEDIGRQMQNIAASVSTPNHVRKAYVDLLRDVTKNYPPIGEPRSARAALHLEPLADVLSTLSPDLVISTKGALVSIAHQACNMASLRVKNAHFVTNPGLLTLSIHNTIADYYLTTLPISRDMLISIGVEPSRIRAIGPLRSSGMIADSAPTVPVGDWQFDASRGTIIIYSNNDQDRYLQLIQSLADAATHNVVFIANGRAEIVAEADRILSRTGVPFLCSDVLSKAVYESVLRRASNWTTSNFVISKSGPNTFLDAVDLGLPVLLHKSGLPMEDWLGSYVGTHKLGRVCNRFDDLQKVLDHWLVNPELVSSFASNARHFSANLPNRHEVSARINAFICEVAVHA
jgi:hypothetical protein